MDMNTRKQQEALLREIQTDVPDAEISFEENDMLVYFNGIYGGKVSKDTPVHEVSSTVDHYRDMVLGMDSSGR